MSENKNFSVDAGFVDSPRMIADKIKKLVNNEKIVLLCVGTEKVCGDSLGPMVGSLVFRRALPNVFVYGMMESNVTAKNLTYAVKFMQVMHPDRKLVVVDAALGTREQIGTVQIVKGGLYPGSATNKNLPKIGDIGILGIVNEYLADEINALCSTKMNHVRFLAGIIASSLTEAFN